MIIAAEHRCRPDCRDSGDDPGETWWQCERCHEPTNYDHPCSCQPIALSLQELAARQGLAARPVPDYVALASAVWPDLSAIEDCTMSSSLVGGAERMHSVGYGPLDEGVAQ